MSEDRSILDRPAAAPDEVIAYGNHPDQVIDLWHTGERAGPVVVLLHGGFWRPQWDRMHLRPMAGALALAPVADLVLAERLDLDEGAVPDFLGVAAEARPDLDPVRLPAPPVPVTVLHGTADDRVPLEVATSYADGRPEVRMVTAPGVDHFAVIDPASAAWPLVIDELRRLAE